MAMTAGSASGNAPSVGETPGWLVEAGFDPTTGHMLWIDNRTGKHHLHG